MSFHCYCVCCWCDCWMVEITWLFLSRLLEAMVRFSRQESSRICKMDRIFVCCPESGLATQYPSHKYHQHHKHISRGKISFESLYSRSYISLSYSSFEFATVSLHIITNGPSAPNIGSQSGTGTALAFSAFSRVSSLPALQKLLSQCGLPCFVSSLVTAPCILKGS